MTHATPRYPEPFPVELSNEDVALAWAEADRTLAWHAVHGGRHHFHPSVVGLDELEVRANGYGGQLVVARATGRRALLHSEDPLDWSNGDVSGGIEVRYAFTRRGEVLRIRPHEDRGKLHRPFALVLSRRPLPRSGAWTTSLAGWEYGSFPVSAGLPLHPRDERGPAFYAVPWFLLRSAAELIAFGPEHDFDVPPTPTRDDWAGLGRAFDAAEPP